MNTPERGDVVWIDFYPNFYPQSSREQAGRRPALVLSPARYNRFVGLLLACPVTKHVKGYPFESPLPADFAVQGVVLSDHVQSLDWRTRHAEFACRAPSEVVEDVAAKVRALIGGES